MLTVGLGLFVLAASPQEPGVWEGLRAGPHEVGFRSSWARDAERPFEIRLEEGLVYEGPRPILVLEWYPAQPSGDLGGVGMSHEALFDIETDAPGLGALSRALARHAREVAIGEITGWKESRTAREEEALAGLFARATPFLRDAPELEGEAPPLVLVHSGAASSFEDNALLCGFLASHGFRVRSSAFLDGEGTSLGIDGGRASILDLAFLAEHERVAGEEAPIAYVGHSLGAQAVLKAAASGDGRAQALVLLDTTQDYYTLETPVYAGFVREVLAGSERVSQSILATASPVAAFLLLDRLEGAERRYLTFPTLDHNEYLSQGLQHVRFEELAGRAVEDAREVRQEFVSLCEYVLAFLRAELLGGDADRRALDEVYRGATLGAGIHLESAAVGDTSPPPFRPSEGVPTPRQFPHVLADLGAEGVRDLLRVQGDGAAARPLSESRMLLGTALFTLIDRGDPEGARTLHGFLESWCPGLLGVLWFQAEFSRLLDRPDSERRMLQALLVLDPDHALARERLEKREAR